MTIWTTFADVTARWVGGGTPTDETLVEALITDAENVILAEFPLIQDRITANTLSADVVTLVTVRMVTRVLRNPENLTYHQQTTGPFGQARNFGSGSVDIWLSEDERRLLSPVKIGKAFSLDLGPNKTNALFPSDIPNTSEPAWIVEDWDE
jgi:hypothetical protein